MGFGFLGKALGGGILGGNIHTAKQFGIPGLDSYVIDAGDTLGQSVGGSINDWTGATDQMNQQYANQAKLANQQFQHQLALQKDAQEFNKHAHQNEVADLKAAGLNPVLSAGGGGTAAAGQGAAAGGTAAVGGGHDPIAMIGNIIGMMNSSKQTEGMVKNMEADSNLKNAEAWKTLNITPAEKAKLEAEYANLIQQINESKDRQSLIKAQTELEEWNARHPIISKIIGGAAGLAGQVTSAAIHAKALGKAAKMNSAKTTVRNNYNSKGNLTGSTVITNK